MEAPFSSFIGWPRAHHTPRLQLNVQRPLLMHVPPSQQQRQQENLFTVPPPFTPFTARLPTTLPQSMDVSSQQSMDASQTTSTSYNYSRQNAGKEKTPMCRIAELARYNRIKHEYNLLDESGPAHQKVFSVSLVLKEGEVYTGKGASIKKAQQDAAAVAWESTKLPKPPQRATQRRPRDAVTPTVIVNAFASKQSLTPVYRNIDPPVGPMGPPHPFMHPGNRFFRPLFGPAPPRLFSVGLRLGNDMPEMIGRGPTRQMARHNAAAQALIYLGPHLTDLAAAAATAAAAVPDKPADNGAQTCAEMSVTPDSSENSQKSTISLVHENALQRRMDVQFELTDESGPAHDRQYSIRCTLTSTSSQPMVADGRGNSKKQAKQDACAQMLAQLEKLGPAPVLPVVSLVTKAKRSVPKELKRKTIVKDIKIDPAYGQQINPVSRLIQVQQGKKEKEPIFELISEKGESRFKEFVVEFVRNSFAVTQSDYTTGQRHSLLSLQNSDLALNTRSVTGDTRSKMRGRKVSPLQVAVNGQKCQGAGPNKKLAKRAAAEAMLDILGYNKPMPMPGKSLLKKKSLQAVETCDAIDESTADKPNISDSTSDNQSEKVETLPKQSTESDGELPDMEPQTRQRRVTFSNEISACPPPDNSMFDFSSGGGKIPGLLFVNKPKRRSKDLKKPLTQRQQQLVADMAKEFLDGQTRTNNEPEIGVFCVPSAASAAPSTLLDRQPAQTAPQSVASVSSAKEKLEYLAGLLKFSVSFTDFPKTTRDDGSGDQHFSLVTLGVSPPQVCHGGGKTESEAQETASLNALRALAERKPDRSSNRNRESFDDSESLSADDAACADGNEEFDDSSLAEEIVERKRPTEPL